MAKTVLVENDNGVIYRYNKVPNNMFNFYLLKKQAYKNGNCLWHLCVEIANPPTGKTAPECVNTNSNFIKLQSFRGTKFEAAKQLDNIIREYT